MTTYPLHFFGDSFTAGDELVDQEYIGNYPPFLTFCEWKKSYPSQGRPSLAHLTDKEMAVLKKKEREKSYAGLLNGNNHGIGGTSIQSIARRVIQHLEETDEKCVIFIQPPDTARWSDYVDGMWVDFGAHGVTSTYDFNPNANYNDYHKFKIIHNTDFSNLVRWYNTLIPLIAYIKNHKNTVDWWLINHGVFNFIPSWIKDNGLKDLPMMNFMDSVKNRIINFPQVDDQNYPYFHLGGHVNQYAHELLAKKLQMLLPTT